MSLLFRKYCNCDLGELILKKSNHAYAKSFQIICLYEWEEFAKYCWHPLGGEILPKSARDMPSIYLAI
jgi:hypothetical protein